MTLAAGALAHVTVDSLQPLVTVVEKAPPLSVPSLAPAPTVRRSLAPVMWQPEVATSNRSRRLSAGLASMTRLPAEPKLVLGAVCSTYESSVGAKTRGGLVGVVTVTAAERGDWWPAASDADTS